MEGICIDSLIKKDEDMSKHSSFKAGGRAEYFATPENEEEVLRCLCYAEEKNLDYYVIGNGSNILVSDNGYNGLIIKLGEKLSKINVDNNIITAYAGALMKDINAAAIENQLSGFEGLSGIPGSIGGAVAMNAGAYDYETKNIVKDVRLINADGEIVTLGVDKLEMGYRSSIFTTNKNIALKIRLELKKEDINTIKDRVNDFTLRREKSQPLEYASAGSTFKRPEGYFVGKLVEDTGLKGISVGDAMVSVKHGGFVINKGKATATEIYELICLIISRIYAKYQVKLQPEVRLIGDFKF